MSEVYLHVRSNAHGVQLIALHKNSFRKCNALVGQGITDATPTQPFVIKMANQSSQWMLMPKSMKVVTCLEAPTSWVDPRESAAQKLGIALEDSGNATQNYKAPESNK